MCARRSVTRSAITCTTATPARPPTPAPSRIRFVHARIPRVALVGLVALTEAAVAMRGTDCPRSTAATLERFIGADCARCWTQAPSAAAKSNEWLFDWIVPSARGDEAPLSPAALDEAAARARRLFGTPLADDLAHRRSVPGSTDRRLRLAVSSGPAWSGYIGVQVDVGPALPRGARVWLALVEHVPAGTDGTPVPRQLVRTVAGPYELPAAGRDAPRSALQALRWPETAKPERLRARAWIEDAGGRLLAVAGDRCPWR